LIFSTLCFAADETLTITTYYPSPYGSYNNLTVANSLSIGTTSPAGKLDVNSSFYTSTGNIVIRPENTADEGGQITLLGAGSYATKYIDNAGTKVRVHSAGLEWANVVSTAGWVAGSSRALKKDIAPLSQEDFEELKQIFKNTPLYSYRRKDEPKYREIGFIAEETPDLISPDHKGIASMRAIGFLAALVKDQEKRIEELEAKLARLQKEK
jgi:hypothetical protein